MDTTETYIKMCKQALRYIKWQPNIGDWVVEKGEIDIVTEVEGYNYRELVWGDSLWRQDQLQEMIEIKTPEEFQEKFIRKDGIWTSGAITHTKTIDTVVRFSSMEQLWLAFVMREKFGKVWTDEDWVQVDGSANSK